MGRTVCYAYSVTGSILMRFEACSLVGVYRIIPEPRADARGWLARTYCAREFAESGLQSGFVQCSTSFSRRRGTLRGVHFQLPPNEEVKLVRCVRGSAYDVVVDLRPDSSSYLKWLAVELTADNLEAIYIPKGCGHGFQALADNTEMFYQMDAYYSPESSAGIRWDDPAVGIRWPIPCPILSERDATFADFQP